MAQYAKPGEGEKLIGKNYEVFDAREGDGIVSRGEPWCVDTMASPERLRTMAEVTGWASRQMNGSQSATTAIAVLYDPHGDEAGESVVRAKARTNGDGGAERERQGRENEAMAKRKDLADLGKRARDRIKQAGEGHKLALKGALEDGPAGEGQEGHPMDDHAYRAEVVAAARRGRAYIDAHQHLAPPAWRAIPGLLGSVQPSNASGEAMVQAMEVATPMMLDLALGLLREGLV